MTNRRVRIYAQLGGTYAVASFCFSASYFTVYLLAVLEDKCSWLFLGLAHSWSYPPISFVIGLVFIRRRGHLPRDSPV